jgi:hypothetical protein
MDYFFLLNGLTINKELLSSIYDVIIKSEMEIRLIFISGLLEGNFYNLAKGYKMSTKKEFLNHFEKGVMDLEGKDYKLKYVDLLLVRLVKTKNRMYSTLKPLKKMKYLDSAIYGSFILNDIFEYHYWYKNKYVKKSYTKKDFKKIKKDFDEILNNNLDKSIFIYIPLFTSLESSFIFKIFFENSNSLSFLMDNSNKMIQIIYKKRLIFRDFNRIFPLIELDKMNIDLFSKQIQEKKDFLWTKYQIRLCDLYSNANLSFRLFRTHYLKTEIPILSKYMYNLIKPSYFGGSAEIYKPYGENLYHYDINSLYPYAMLNDMPGNYLKYEKNILSLDNFFGFIYCEIEISKNILIPMVPIRCKNNKIIYPVGKMKGLYFSEEIKSWMKLGYKIKLNSGYSFERIKSPFLYFIKDFYKFKMESKDKNLKLLSKSLLNGLYGYFARNPFYSEFKIISDKDKEWDTLMDCDWIENLNDSYWLIKKPMKFNTMELFNSLDFNNFTTIYSNIAMASAITSYARIHMQNYKLMSNTILYYSDTDSIFINHPLKEVNKNIGFMKLENKIKEIYFLAPKVYAYLNDKNETIIKSAGFPSTHLNFNDFKKIYNNLKLDKKIYYTQLEGKVLEFNLKKYELNLENLKKESYSRQWIHFNGHFLYSKPFQIDEFI